ncbi:MAG: 4Fe-4S binding protein, partial [Thermodesulfobacteriota bacterium]
MMQVGMNNEVLVIGAGSAGLAAAGKIAGQGYCVTLAESGADGDSVTGDINILQDAVLDKLDGFAGDFRATFVKDGNRLVKTFGAVVAAPEYDTLVMGEPYGLAEGDGVISQSRLESYLSTGEGLNKLKNGNGSTVAFLTGYGKESCPENFERLIKSAIALQEIENCSSYVFAKNVKVGGQGLENLFTKGRHQGVICFKPEETPRVEQGAGGLTIRCSDPVVRTDMELAPDYVVLEEMDVPGESSSELARRLKIDRDLEGYLQSNNVHRFPVGTNREGVFVAHADDSATNIALRINELLYDGVKNVPEDKVVVDSERCVLCLTCYRCCPHGAITWNNDAAVISPVACFGCGICASECPMDAIQLGEFTDDDITKAVQSAAVSGASPSIVAFCCENSGLEAF